MNSKSELPSFDWEMIDFEHSDLKCSHCPDSKLFNIHFSLFFCKMCRTYLSCEERQNTCVSIHLSNLQPYSSFNYVMSFSKL